MKKKYFYPVVAITIFGLLFSCTSPKKTVSDQTSSQQFPKALAEFRAAWVATVANINWPSKPGLSTDEQKKEAIELLDFLQQHHFNAVILQVRPQCDALYKSDLEPWSYYLTGKQGQAPFPYYDPLEFWTEAAHDRGIEMHVWLNPYRAHHKDGKEITEHSIIKKRPELALYLKEGYWWLDPAQKGTQDHSTAVVMDLVKRYDIDGVHFDDYFYPYPSYNLGADFPDSVSWNAYQQSGGKLSRGDWRREAVNVFIENLYKKIKAVKPFVKFGLSPFGIWRPGYPESVAGFDQYEQLYADAKLWLNKGWIDYFTPQLYWPINRQNASFPVLLGWWAGENTMKRHLWPGMSVGRDTSIRSVNETLNQIMITRGMVPESKGAVHWSISSVTKNPNLAKALLESTYKNQAIVPASPWLDNKAPDAPKVSTSKTDKITISWSHPDERDVFRWVVYFKYGNNWNYTILNRNERSFTLNPGTEVNKKIVDLKEVAVTAVDRTGNESARNQTTIN
ncbi:MAG TPA: family 10 glycosylhydrolase [Chitinophagaceae bacterium]|nr:family 10 glycosylhydrolase [Chitinophagaceae bacterium]